jgi:hypothetical protein
MNPKFWRSSPWHIAHNALSAAAVIGHASFSGTSIRGAGRLAIAHSVSVTPMKESNATGHWGLGFSTRVKGLSSGRLQSVHAGSKDARKKGPMHKCVGRHSMKSPKTVKRRLPKRPSNYYLPYSDEELVVILSDAPTQANAIKHALRF